MQRWKLAILVVAAATLSGIAGAQTQKNPATKKTDVTPATVSQPVTGAGTAGQITKWVGSNPINYTVGDSVITEDKVGNIGIGTTTPASKFTVAGTIETTLGGVRFPDGSTQTTAGMSSVAHDATLAGNGTVASPLGIATGGVGTVQIANAAVTGLKIAPGAVANLQLADAAVTGPKIAASAVGNPQLADSSVTASKIGLGQVVKALNGLSDSVQLVAGSNITLTPSGNTLTISGTGQSGSTASQAFQAAAEITNNDGTTEVTISVPAGKRLVIENVSAFASTLNGSPVCVFTMRTAINGAPPVNHFFRSDFLQFDIAGGRSFVIGQVVRIYSDGPVVFKVFNGNSQETLLHVTLSGYLIDL